MDIEGFEEWLYNKTASKQTRKVRMRYIRYVQKLGIDPDTIDKDYKIAKMLFEQDLPVHSHNNCVVVLNLYFEYTGSLFKLKKIPRKGEIDRYVPSDRIVKSARKAEWRSGYLTRKYRLLIEILAKAGARSDEARKLRREDFGYKEIRSNIAIRSVMIQKFLRHCETEGIELTVNEFRTLVDGDLEDIASAVGMDMGLEDFKGGTIKNYYVHVVGKGNKERNIPIPEDLYKNVMEYAALDSSRGGYLFPNRSGKPISNHRVRVSVKHAGRSVGEEKLHPHSLRHWRARDLWRKGVDILVISRFLGHSDLQTTKLYLEAITEDERFEEIMARDPFFGLGEVVLKDIFFQNQLPEANSSTVELVFAQNQELSHSKG